MTDLNTDEPYVDEYCIDCGFEKSVDDSLWQDDIGTAICMAYMKLNGLERDV